MTRWIGPRPARARLRPAKRERGFTLIEIVVAFVLLALIFSTSFEVFSSGMRRAADLEDQSRAVVVAQSRLAVTGMEEQLKQGSVSGTSEDGRFQWTVAVTPTDEATPPPGQPQPGPGTYMFYRINVRVDWKGADQRPHTYALAGAAIGGRP
jgi:general secretion pathway protein I